MKRFAVLIMAAGEASRFGGCKLLTEIDNKSMLQRMIDEANAVAQGHVYVVTGCYHDDMHQQTTDAHLLHNEQWQEGLGKSIAYGVSEIHSLYDAILIVLADQVCITRTHLKKLMEQYDERHIVSAHYAGVNAVPALFPHKYFKALLKLQGDKGAKFILNNSDIVLTSLNMPEAALDIDTPYEHEMLSSQSVH